MADRVRLRGESFFLRKGRLAHLGRTRALMAIIRAGGPGSAGASGSKSIAWEVRRTRSLAVGPSSELVVGIFSSLASAESAANSPPAAALAAAAAAPAAAGRPSASETGEVDRPTGPPRSSQAAGEGSAANSSGPGALGATSAAHAPSSAAGGAPVEAAGASAAAWQEKKDWGLVLSIPDPELAGARARSLHAKLMSPDRKKKTPVEMQARVEAKQARAEQLREQLERERAAKREKHASGFVAARTTREQKAQRAVQGLGERIQRGAARHHAFIVQRAQRALHENRKVGRPARTHLFSLPPFPLHLSSPAQPAPSFCFGLDDGSLLL